ncbi:MAG: asparagine synthase (glutamine-hydrolyzing) [Planctomycetaceae bacterium]|nr:asparagine synthase (glutamine-hydrolyzing) [Planctomycetaceae bacterium]
MCGISGILNFSGQSPSPACLRRMNGLQRQRGPDGAGEFFRDGVALGHRRLSIIDLAGGQQPLTNEDRQVWLSFNGEIYNHHDLRCQLESLGHVFATQSDSEVIVHAYEQWGTNCVRKFRGMFAFVIADFREQRLFVARDPFGIKPVYLRADRDFVAVASQISALVGGEFGSCDLDLQAIDYYLRYRYIPSPRTIYEDIVRLPAGHVWTCNFDGTHVQRYPYWQFDFQPDPVPSMGEWEEQFAAELQSSVDAHLASDVPVGAFLSGGVDSTLVASAMVNRLGGNLKVFTIGFEDQAYSELPYARQAAAQLGVELHAEVVKPDVVGVLEKLFASYGEPFADTSAVPTWCVSRLAAGHVKAVLSGDGADEAFAGYRRYDTWMMDGLGRDLRRIYKHPKRLGYELVKRLTGSNDDRRRRWETQFVGVLDDRARHALWRTDFSSVITNSASAFTNAHRQSQACARLDYAQAMDLQTYLPDDILRKVDVASMCHGLEVRTPFVDPKMVQFAARLPAAVRRSSVFGRSVLKALPKRYLAHRFSKNFAYRRKQGFAIPERAWLQQGSPVRDCFNDVVQSRHARIRELFCGQEIDRRVRDFDDRGRDATALWLLLILGFWIEHHQAQQIDYLAA